MTKYEYAPTDPRKVQGVPRDLLPHVESFCHSLSAETPVFLPINIDESAAQLDCLNNVRQRIEKSGGDMVLGWQIWEWYGVMIEAEFHAAWRKPDGELVDVTPKPVECDRSLFVADSSLKYEGRQINNRRRSLLDDPRVAQFIALANEEFIIMNSGDRADLYKIALDDEETKRYNEIQIRKFEIQVAIMNETPGRNHPCRCGSDKKYKKCHGGGYKQASGTLE